MAVEIYQQEVSWKWHGTKYSRVGDKQQEVAVTAFVGFTELCPSNFGHSYLWLKWYPSNQILHPPKCKIFFCISGRGGTL
jgi:hypothetical protein